MGRALLVLRGPSDRSTARHWIDKAPDGTRVEFRSSKRTLPQNDRMWEMLTRVSRKVQWHGMTLPPADWKLLFMDALNRELRAVPNLDGTGFVNLGQRSSELTKNEMSQMQELIEAFCAQRGVDLWEDAA